MYYRNSGYQGLNYDTGPQYTKRHISTHKPSENRDDGSSRQMDLHQIVDDLQPNEIQVLLELLKVNNLEMEDLSQYRRELQECIRLLMRCEPSKRWSFYIQIKDQFFSRSDFVSYIKRLLCIFLENELHSSSHNTKYPSYKTSQEELHPSHMQFRNQPRNQNRLRNTIQLPLDSRYYTIQSDITTNSSVSTRSTDSMCSDSVMSETVSEPLYMHMKQPGRIISQPHSISDNHSCGSLSYHSYEKPRSIYSHLSHLSQSSQQSKTFPLVNRDSVSYPPYPSISHRYYENKCKSIPIDIELLESWGSLESIGLEGIKFIDQKNIEIKPNSYSFSCRCTCSATGTLENCNVLFNFRNCPDFYPCIHVDLPSAFALKEIRIKNYNRETEKGVKFVKIYINHSLLGNNKIYICKGPGVPIFDFSQQISVSRPSTVFNLLPKPQVSANPFVNLEQDYCCPVHPCGSILQFQFHSNWGDINYLGLNQILLYNPEGEPLTVNQSSVFSYPQSEDRDKNTPFHACSIFSGSQGWITSICRKSEMLNCIYVLFQVPIVIGCIKICNYSNIPTCGIKALTILMDNNIIYSGDIRKNERSSPHFAQSILFTNNPILQEKEKGNIYHAPVEHLVLIDNKTILSLSSPELKQEFNSSYHFS